MLSQLYGLDAVFFTGDITHSGRKDEFDKLNEFLTELWETFKKLDLDPLFIAVPGNHDLERPTDVGNAGYLALNHYCDDPKVQGNFWQEGSDLLSCANNLFANYQQWIATLPVDIRCPDQESTGLITGDFATKIIKEDICFGVLGLNSAFLHYRDDCHRQLAVHTAQTHKACGKDYPKWLRSVDMCILLTHHPTDWLCPSAEDQFNSEIYPTNGRLVLHLCGHMHESNFTTIGSAGAVQRNTNQEHSLFGLETWGEKRERRHGYSLGEITIEGARAQLRFWPRRLQKRQGGSSSFDRDTTWSIPRGSESTGPIRIDCHARRRAELSDKENADLDESQSKIRHVIKLTRAGKHLFGRKDELDLLDSYWRSLRTYVVEIKAWGGVGKTTLVWHWLNRLQQDSVLLSNKVFLITYMSKPL